jgi:hypothetical protein
MMPSAPGAFQQVFQIAVKAQLQWRRHILIIRPESSMRQTLDEITDLFIGVKIIATNVAAHLLYLRLA